MLRLIKDSESGCFLCNDGSWTLDWSEAQHFENITKVLLKALELDKASLDQVLIVADKPSEYDLTIALSPVLNRHGVKK